MDFFLEGNIASGKSTVLRVLAELHPDEVEIVPEPVDEWASLLDWFYSDMSRWIFALQITVLHHFLRKRSGPRNRPFRIFERSPIASKKVFADLAKKAGIFVDAEYKTYEQIYEKSTWNASATIYIRTKPETCVDRLKRRNRAEDTKIDATYVRKVHDKYQELVSAPDIFNALTIVDGDDVTPEEIAHLVWKAILDASSTT